MENVKVRGNARFFIPLIIIAVKNGGSVDENNEKQIELMDFKKVCTAIFSMGIRRHWIARLPSRIPA